MQSLPSGSSTLIADVRVDVLRDDTREARFSGREERLSYVSTSTASGL
jgi:hypothetical protein